VTEILAAHWPKLNCCSQWRDSCVCDGASIDDSHTYSYTNPPSRSYTESDTHNHGHTYRYSDSYTETGSYTPAATTPPPRP
jgi:hypothetical protein